MVRYRTILTIIVVFLGFTLIIPNTFAAEKTTLIEDMYTVLGIALNIIYIITLPLLTIAGKAMDNSMVYGEFLNLDKPLYMLRNISRTFSNFAIGGVFLYNIIKYMFTERGDNIEEVRKIVTNGLIAVLAINFSWFLLGVLFDISSILIYGLGSMPLSIINQTSTSNMPILSVNTFLDYSDSKSKTSLYYQRQGSQGTINIAQCGQDGNIYKGMITGPEYYPILPNSKPEVSFKVQSSMKTFCAIHNDVIDISKLITWRENNLSPYINTTANITGTDYQYHTMIKEIIDNIAGSTGNCSSISVNGFNPTAGEFKLNTIEEVKAFANVVPTFGQKSFCSGTVVFGNADPTNILTSQGSWKKGFITANSPGYEGYSNPDGFSTKTLLDQSKGMVGPFVTLYVSLLDFSNLSINNSSIDDSNKAIGGIIEFFVRTIIGILLLIPLIALAVTMIIRVVVLRGVIAFIPLGITMKLVLDGKGASGQKLFGAELNATSIIGLIFSPVLPVFALSISIIFIQALQGQMGQDFNESAEKRSLLGIEFVNQKDNPNLTCADFWGLQELCYTTDDNTKSGSIFVNLFPWLFTNIFAIALMWFLVKAAMAASPITQKAADSIMDAGQSLLSNIPIIPIGDGKVGLGAASSIPEKFLSTASSTIEDLDKKGETEMHEMIKNLMDGKGAKTDGELTGQTQKKDFSSTTKTTVKENLKANSANNITNQTFLESLKTATNGHNEDQKEYQKIQGLQGSQQTNEVVAAIENIYSDDKTSQKRYINDVVIERLGEMIDGTASNERNSVKPGKEQELVEFINLKNIKSYINSNGNETMKNNFEKLTYKNSKDNKEYILKDFQRKEKTATNQ